MSTNQSDLNSSDPSGISALVQAFPSQCREALETAKAVELPTLEAIPAIVAVAGMGAQAEAGDIAKALFEAHGGAALIVVRDYSLPNYIGVGDVVFCCSYFGDTAETLSAYEAAKKAGARLIAITSGGKLAEMAKEDDFPIYEIPTDQDPRTAFGYALVSILIACEQMKLLADPGIEAAIGLVDNNLSQWNEKAASIAESMQGTLPIIYGLGSWQASVANRWRSQINENAKQLAFTNSYPELSHNELAGWSGASKQGVTKFVGIALEDGAESEEIRSAVRAAEDQTSGTISFQHVSATGESLIEKILSLTLLGDLVSLHLARLNGVESANNDTAKARLI